MIEGMKMMLGKVTPDFLPDSNSIRRKRMNG